MRSRSKRFNRLSIWIAGLLYLALISGFSGCSEDKNLSTLASTHPSSWIEADSPDFHGKVVMARGSVSCRVCHGADLNGGESGVSCVECHLTEGGCTTCHGGLDNGSGAPPYDLRGDSSISVTGVGAHTAHVEGTLQAAVVPCLTCHLVPATPDDSNHIESPIPDSIAEIVWGGIEAGGTAVWDHDKNQCTNTYSHGNFAGGDTLNVPIWTQKNHTNCGSCHDIGDNPAQLLWKHEFHVGILGFGCYRCHAGMIDESFTITNPSLHVNGQVDTLIADQAVCDACHGTGAHECTACHGGLIDTTGAPPYGLRGETATTSLAVGAHTTHLAGSAIAAAIACSTCHQVPETTVDSAHLDLGAPVRDSIAEIVWSGLGNNGHTVWDRTTGECSGGYCHGGFLGGNSQNLPVWTGIDQAECGSCHDVEGDSLSLGLLGAHKFHVGTAAIKCSICHSSVVDDDLKIINTSLHVNGSVQSLVADPGLCDVCHGFSNSCIVCHGGQDNNTGAPPVGLDNETATTELAVGAHTKHLSGGTISDGIACSECHIKPSRPLDAGHLDSDGIPDMDFGPLAGAASTWNRSSATCGGTYCHGNFSGGYDANSPVWTSGGSQATCGSCHAVNSDYSSLSGMHQKHIIDKEVECYQCHAATVDSSLVIVGMDVHIDGTKDVSFSSGQGSFNNGQCSNTDCHETESWYGGKAQRVPGPRP